MCHLQFCFTAIILSFIDFSACSRFPKTPNPILFLMTLAATMTVWADWLVESRVLKFDLRLVVSAGSFGRRMLAFRGCKSLVLIGSKCPQIWRLHLTPSLHLFKSEVSKLVCERATQANAQQFEDGTSYAMRLFRDMLHSTKSANFSQIDHLFITVLTKCLRWPYFGDPGLNHWQISNTVSYFICCRKTSHYLRKINLPFFNSWGTCSSEVFLPCCTSCI